MGLRIEIEVGSDPICGTLQFGALGPFPFSGWIELAGVIESARAEKTSAGPSGSAPAGFRSELRNAS